MRIHDDWNRAILRRHTDLTPSIRLFELEAEGPRRFWSAGAHLRLRLADGDIRSYSLVDTGADDGLLRIAVKRIDGGRGGSRRMWSLPVGARIEISQPHQEFGLDPGASSYTLLAGGIGITPLLGMARELSRQGRRLGFHYVVHTPADAAFADLLRSWLGDDFHLHVGSQGGRPDLGRLVSEIEARGQLYVCGPLGMLEAAREAWKHAGRPPELLRFETFGSGGIHASQPFTAILPRFGVTLDVAANQSLLSALEQAGIEVLSDCRRGECGLCAVDILQSECAIDHRDVFFSADQKRENLKLCSCVSRPVGGRIELDTAFRGAVAGGRPGESANPPGRLKPAAE